MESSANYRSGVFDSRFSPASKCDVSANGRCGDVSPNPAMYAKVLPTTAVARSYRCP